MAKITKEELLKIAQISQVRVYEHEIPSLLKQIEDLLTYAERVQEVAADIEDDQSYQNVNVMREDVIIKTDDEPILNQAPEEEENFFVVPRIIENK